MKIKKIKEWSPKARKAAKAFGIKKLATEIGRSSTYLSQMSRADVATTSETATKLATALNINASEFGQGDKKAFNS